MIDYSEEGDKLLRAGSLPRWPEVSLRPAIGSLDLTEGAGRVVSLLSMVQISFTTG